MSEEGVLIPTVAPGQWRTAMKPDGSQIVTATFAGSRDAAAVQAQLLSWLRALGACVESAREKGATTILHLPQSVTERDGAMVVEFSAPKFVGDAGLAAPRTPLQTLDLLARLAAGLDALHASHIVHGGLGLPSLWWMADGSIVLADVALAHSLEDVLPASSAAAGYRSPEVWRGRGHVAASDQYALAVMAFELLSGRRRLVQEDADHIVSIEPMVMQPGARLYPGAPDALNDVLQRALAASPTARFPSCTAFVEALAGHVDEVKSTSTVHRARWMGDGRASRRVMALGAVAMASVATALVVLRGSIEPTSLPRGLPASLPRLDASVLPTASASSQSDRFRAPGALPSGGGRGGVSTRVRGELPRSTATGTASSGSAVSGRLSTGAPTTGAPPATVQRGELANGTTLGSATGTSMTTPIVRTGAASAPAGKAPSVLDRVGNALGRTVQQSPPARPPVTTSGVSAGTIVDQGAPSAAGASSNGGRSSTSTPVGARTATDSRTPPSITLPTLAGPTAQGTLPARSTATGTPAPAPISPAPNIGTVQLDVPSGSRIYVDGVLVRPSGTRLSIPAGAHDIDIVSGTGVRVRRRISVVAGETITVRK